METPVDHVLYTIYHILYILHSLLYTVWQAFNTEPKQPLSLYICIHTCIHIDIYLYTTTYITIYIYTYMYIDTHTYIHMYIHTYMYIHIFIYMPLTFRRLHKRLWLGLLRLPHGARIGQQGCRFGLQPELKPSFR